MPIIRITLLAGIFALFHGDEGGCKPETSDDHHEESETHHEEGETAETDGTDGTGTDGTDGTGTDGTDTTG